MTQMGYRGLILCEKRHIGQGELEEMGNITVAGGGIWRRTFSFSG